MADTEIHRSAAQYRGSPPAQVSRRAQLPGSDPRSVLGGFIDSYLSDAHAASPEQGCPMPSLAGEVARMHGPVRVAMVEGMDRLIEANGNLPGEFMGAVFNQMTPMRSMMKYNWDMLEVVDYEKRLLNWLRMEKWIADRPDHPG